MFVLLKGEPQINLTKLTISYLISAKWPWETEGRGEEVGCILRWWLQLHATFTGDQSWMCLAAICFTQRKITRCSHCQICWGHQKGRGRFYTRGWRSYSAMDIIKMTSNVNFDARQIL